MKKTVSLLLALCLLLTLCACGSQKTDPNLGKYNCVSLVLDGVSMDPSGEWIDLQADGKLSMYLMDEPDDGTWTISDGAITIHIDDSGDLTGTIADGVINVNIQGVDCIFARDGASYTLPSALPEPTAEPTAEPEAVTPEQVWGAEWFGSLTINDCTGSWKGNEGIVYRADGVVRIDGDQSYFELFLPDDGFDEDAFISMYITADAQHFEINDDAAWVMDMDIPSELYGDYNVTFVPGRGNLIEFSSSYSDPEETDAGFTFTVQLRPFGSVWDEAADAVPERYSDYLEYIYTDNCTVNVVDGITGEVLVDRGSPVYVPGVSGDLPESGGADETGGESEGGDAEYLKDGRLTSRDGYFSFVPPQGWDADGTSQDNNQIYASTDGMQVNIMLDYLNGYTVEEMAKRETFSTDTYEYDTSVPLGTLTLDGRTYYYAGPVVSFGDVHYYMFTEWTDDMFVNVNIDVYNSKDTASLAKFVASQTWTDLINSIQISKP